MSSSETPPPSLNTDADDKNVNTMSGNQPLSEQASSLNNNATETPPLIHLGPNGEPDQAASQRKTEANNIESEEVTAEDAKHKDTEREETPTPPVESLSLSQPEPSDSRTSLRVHTGRENPPAPPKKDDPYLDPTPRTPQAPRSPTGTPADQTNKDLPEIPAQQDVFANGDGDGDLGKEQDRQGDDSQPEIQTIMDQFTDETKSLGQDEIMSPRLELADQFRTTQTHHFPSRKSSLEPTKSLDAASEQHQHQLRPWRSQPTSQFSRDSQHSPSPPAVPPKSPPRSSKEPQQAPSSIEQSVASPSAQPAVIPAPEPEPDQPFDFHRFLEQLRHRTADPVAKFLRSFLTEFGKRQWMVHEQVKIISDFLTFITHKMAQCEVWRDISDVEFDNAKEGMEKLVMNRLYSQTFSPAIPATPAPPRSRSRSRRKEMSRTPGRKGQHQEDVERDDVLAQKIRIYSWVREQHLDIPPLGSNGRRFLALAQQELLKIKGYRAPRDKVICVMNCCKVIFGLLRNSKSGDTSADSFVPLLIYVVLRANPEHIVSNIQYILRFRNQDKLGGEAGYYLSSLSGAIQFIETLDRTSLTVSDEEFEKNVEAAVSAIAERDQASEDSPSKEKPLPPIEGEPSYRPKEAPSATSDNEDNAAVSGILRTIQKPLTTIGRIFSDETEPPREQPQQQPYQQQQQASASYAQHVSQIPAQAAITSPPQVQQQGYRGPYVEKMQNTQEQAPSAPNTYDAQEAAARQASAEAAEARRIQRAEHNGVVETLSNMFPNLDKDVIDDVVRMKEGRVGLAVDACLALNAE